MTNDLLLSSYIKHTPIHDEEQDGCRWMMTHPTTTLTFEHPLFSIMLPTSVILLLSLYKKREQRWIGSRREETHHRRVVMINW